MAYLALAVAENRFVPHTDLRSRQGRFDIVPPVGQAKGGSAYREVLLATFDEAFGNRSLPFVQSPSDSTSPRPFS